MLLPVQDAMVVRIRTQKDSFRNDELHHEMSHALQSKSRYGAFRRRGSESIYISTYCVHRQVVPGDSQAVERVEFSEQRDTAFCSFQKFITFLPRDLADVYQAFQYMPYRVPR